MKRSLAILIGATLGWSCNIGLVYFPSQAEGSWSWASGIGPHLPRLPAIHVGHFYYHPSSGQHSVATLEHLQARRARIKKLRCDSLHAQYIARHGAFTPAPLARSHGCAKWRRDSAYWRQRRHEIQTHYNTSPVQLLLDMRHQINL